MGNTLWDQSCSGPVSQGQAEAGDTQASQSRDRGAVSGEEDKEVMVLGTAGGHSRGLNVPCSCVGLAHPRHLRAEGLSEASRLTHSRFT